MYAWTVEKCVYNATVWCTMTRIPCGNEQCLKCYWTNSLTSSVFFYRLSVNKGRKKRWYGGWRWLIHKDNTEEQEVKNEIQDRPQECQSDAETWWLWPDTMQEGHRHQQEAESQSQVDGNLWKSDQHLFFTWRAGGVSGYAWFNTGLRICFILTFENAEKCDF